MGCFLAQRFLKGLLLVFLVMVVENGDTVKIEYEGKLDSGEVFDSSSKHGQPLEFKVGSGMVIKGFDEAVVGMDKDEEKDFSIKPEEAYGERKDDLKKEIPKSALPEGKEPQKGMTLIVSNQQGQQMPVKIEEVKDESIVLDLNHPLAGQNLNFNVKVTEIQKGD